MSSPSGSSYSGSPQHRHHGGGGSGNGGARHGGHQGGGGGGGGASCNKCRKPDCRGNCNPCGKCNNYSCRCPIPQIMPPYITAYAPIYGPGSPLFSVYVPPFGAVGTPYPGATVVGPAFGPGAGVGDNCAGGVGGVGGYGAGYGGYGGVGVGAPGVWPGYYPPVAPIAPMPVPMPYGGYPVSGGPFPQPLPPAASAYPSYPYPAAAVGGVPGYGGAAPGYGYGLPGAPYPAQAYQPFVASQKWC